MCSKVLRIKFMNLKSINYLQKVKNVKMKGFLGHSSTALRSFLFDFYQTVILMAFQPPKFDKWCKSCFCYTFFYQKKSCDVCFTHLKNSQTLQSDRLSKYATCQTSSNPFTFFSGFEVTIITLNKAGEWMQRTNWWTHSLSSFGIIIMTS